jgi:hypothetical protein
MAGGIDKQETNLPTAGRNRLPMTLHCQLCKVSPSLDKAPEE